MVFNLRGVLTSNFVVQPDDTTLFLDRFPFHSNSRCLLAFENRFVMVWIRSYLAGQERTNTKRIHNPEVGIFLQLFTLRDGTAMSVAHAPIQVNAINDFEVLDDSLQVSVVAAETSHYSRPFTVYWEGQDFNQIATQLFGFYVRKFDWYLPAPPPPSPSPSPSSTPSRSSTPSFTPTISKTPSRTPTNSPSSSPSTTPSPFPADHGNSQLFFSGPYPNDTYLFVFENTELPLTPYGPKSNPVAIGLPGDILLYGFVSYGRAHIVNPANRDPFRECVIDFTSSGQEVIDMDMVAFIDQSFLASGYAVGFLLRSKTNSTLFAVKLHILQYQEDSGPNICAHFFSTSFFSLSMPPHNLRVHIAVLDNNMVVLSWRELDSSTDQNRIKFAWIQPTGQVTPLYDSNVLFGQVASSVVSISGLTTVSNLIEYTMSAASHGNG